MIPRQMQTDPLRAKQVLVNLVGNAIKFTETGRVKISIFREISYFTHTIRFEVSDTGIGMTAEQMSSCSSRSRRRMTRPRAGSAARAWA